MFFLRKIVSLRRIEKHKSMLKAIRRSVAAIVFILITLLFADFTGSLHLWFGWLARVQLIPAILAHNAVIIASLVLLTLLFGRLYCSVICPLGILQDGISHLSGRRKGHKNRFRYSRPMSWLRYGVLVLFVVALVAGVGVVVSLLDPYAGFGRMAENFFAPVYRLGNNALAWFSERADSYAFYTTEVWIKSWVVFGVSVATLLVVGVLSWRHGRTWCNTICPVGTLLGFVSRFSLFRPAIDKSKCTECGVCARACKSSCIDSKNRAIDQSRCVTCFNCIEKCNFGAITYTARRGATSVETQSKTSQKQTVSAKTPGNAPQQQAGPVKIQTVAPAEVSGGVSRRGFLSIAGMLAASSTLRAQQLLQVDGGLADIEPKKAPERMVPIVPAGAEGAAHLKQHCTACQLCVSACPNGVLRPSSKLATLMQPEMSYERGYCRPECVECSLVCPSRAITPVTTAEKSAISIGHAVWIRHNCIVHRDNVPCDNCFRHCPTGAITLVERQHKGKTGDSHKTPVIDKELCIGCGACENLCPARPFSAIYVEGNVKHHVI